MYAYDRAGRLLQDVRLYDSHGRPLDWGVDFANPDRRPVTDAEGAPVLNAFPIRYFEPGTNDVANPEAAPPLTPPRLTTQPLGRQRSAHDQPPWAWIVRSNSSSPSATR